MSATPILVRRLVIQDAPFDCFLRDNFRFVPDMTCAFGAVIHARLNCR